MNSTLLTRGLRPASQLGADRPHGSRLRYLAGCRCLKCRCANANYAVHRAREIVYGRWNGVIDAGAVRAHLRKLSRAGVGTRTIARQAGIGRTCIELLRTGARSRIRALAARRILAVTVNQLADHATVPAGPTWRRLNQLLDEGFTKRRLAHELGIGRSLQIRRTRVLVRTERAVEVLWRKYMQV